MGSLLREMSLRAFQLITCIVSSMTLSETSACACNAQSMECRVLYTELLLPILQDFMTGN